MDREPTMFNFKMLAARLEVTPLSAGIALCFVVVLLYVRNYRSAVKYHMERAARDMGQLPPKYPSLIPYLGSIVPMLWDYPSFFRRAASHAGQVVSSRVCLYPGFDLHLFQDRETIKDIWKKSAMMSAKPVQVYASSYFFGMPEESMRVFRADNSGPNPKAYSGTNILPEKRYHRILNEATGTALTGKGLKPLLERFRTTLITQMREQGPQDKEWMDISDFRKFVHNTIGRSLVESIFGPSMLSINPDLLDDLYEFDECLPQLAKGLPSFLAPRAHKVRRKLHEQLKRWHKYAKSHFTESSIHEDGDADPFWGSNWMRQRRKVLEMIPDEDTLAAADLGVAWASIQNAAASATLAMVHVSKTPDLGARIRQELESDFGHKSLQEMDLKVLSSNDLLSSIYAETLRLHVKSFTVINSPHEDIALGRYRFPRGNFGLVNSDISHMDSSFWNTKGGLHPVQSFWADRFLVDPAQSQENTKMSPQQILTANMQAVRKGDKPYFSLEGLDGSWIPYGGGSLVCPGRFLAKNIITFACALLATEYDMDVLTNRLEFSTGWYGFGTEVLNHKVQVRMRRRE